MNILVGRKTKSLRVCKRKSLN